MFGAVGRSMKRAFRPAAGPRRLHERLEALERASQGSAATYLGNNRVLVRVSVEGALFAVMVPADDVLIAPWFIVTGAYETDLTDFFAAALRPDSICIDVGANFGYFTCLMGRLCPRGRVAGIEADRAIYEMLRDNIAINGFTGHARAIHAAAGDGSELTLFRRTTRPGNTSIINFDEDFTTMMGEPPVQRFTVPGVRIDDLRDTLGGRIDFIKIDVEGAEPLVFAGALETLRTNPQLAIVMEWSPGQIQTAGFDLGGFIDVFRQEGLAPYTLAGGRPQPISYEEVAGLPYQAGIMLQRRS